MPLVALFVGFFEQAGGAGIEEGVEKIVFRRVELLPDFFERRDVHVA